MRTKIPIASGPLVRVAREMDKQDMRWGEQTHPDGTDASFKGLADAARAETEEAARTGRLTWADILKEEFFEVLAETDPQRLAEELTQVAAVCGNWMNDLHGRQVGLAKAYAESLPDLENSPAYDPIATNPAAVRDGFGGM